MPSSVENRFFHSGRNRVLRIFTDLGVDIGVQEAMKSSLVDLHETAWIDSLALIRAVGGFLLRL